MSSLWAMGLSVFMLTLLVADALKQRHITPAITVAVLLLGLAARYALRDYQRRAHGKAVEVDALARLTREGVRRGWRVQCNLQSVAGGDLDALIDTGTRRYAVEVKSWGGLRVAGARVVKLNGALLPGDPFIQCSRNAAPVGATAVLWLPAAPRRRGWFHHQGVLVVNGDARTLCNRIEKWT